MSLTTAQLTTLKAAIAAETNAEFVAYRQQGATGAMADWYNQPAAPVFVVWKPTVETALIGKTVSYLAIAAMTTANLDRVNNFLNLNPQEFDPSRSDIRTFMTDTFSGALGGAGQTTRDALEALYRREAKRGEKLYAIGTGTTAAPAVMGFVGDISNDDVVKAINLP
jgi:hypothetical protein